MRATLAFNELNIVIGRKVSDTTLKNISFNNSNYYGLPKIYKSLLMKEGIEKQDTDTITAPSDLKLRPIAEGSNGPTRKLSNLTDILLKPFIKEFKSYVRGSTDFLNKCQRDVNSNSKIVTFDVVSLFTNILHYLGLEGINYFFTTFPANMYLFKVNNRNTKKCVK